ncbi:hypothetical protein H4219_002371 [Mycoemilia scoparia]|uniref:MI domain-containing protein n=1 Tax=Mycoemilia scoparia TaxID=417184 RepID=A0A9W8DP77_9FUNG|nr:hypothetical protein H4219_002371 [Mycoemilia scoparia]
MNRKANSQNSDAKAALQQSAASQSKVPRKGSVTASTGAGHGNANTASATKPSHSNSGNVNTNNVKSAAPPLSFASAAAAAVAKSSSESNHTADTPSRHNKRNPQGSERGGRPASVILTTPVRIPQRDSVAGHISNIQFGSVSQKSSQPPPPPPTQKPNAGPQSTSGGVPSSQPQSATKPTFGTVPPVTNPGSYSQPQQGDQRNHHPRSNSFTHGWAGNQHAYDHAGQSSHPNQRGHHHHHHQGNAGHGKGYMNNQGHHGEYRRKGDNQRSDSFSRYNKHRDQHQFAPNQQPHPNNVPYMYGAHHGHYPPPPPPHGQDQTIQGQHPMPGNNISQPPMNPQGNPAQQQVPLPPPTQQQQQPTQMPIPNQGYSGQDMYYQDQRGGPHGHPRQNMPPQVAHHPQAYYIQPGSSPMQRPRDKSAHPYPVPYHMAPIHHMPGPGGNGPQQNQPGQISQPPPMGAMPGNPVPGWNVHNFYSYPNIPPVQQMYPMQTMASGHPSYQIPQGVAGMPNTKPIQGIPIMAPSGSAPSSNSSTSRLNASAATFKTRESKKIQIINPNTKQPVDLKPSQDRRGSVSDQSSVQNTRNTPTPSSASQGIDNDLRPSSQHSFSTPSNTTEKVVFSIPKTSKAIQIVNPNVKVKDEKEKEKEDSAVEEDTRAPAKEESDKTEPVFKATEPTVTSKPVKEDKPEADQTKTDTETTAADTSKAEEKISEETPKESEDTTPPPVATPSDAAPIEEPSKDAVKEEQEKPSDEAPRTEEDKQEDKKEDEPKVETSLKSEAAEEDNKDPTLTPHRVTFKEPEAATTATTTTTTSKDDSNASEKDSVESKSDGSEEKDFDSASASGTKESEDENGNSDCEDKDDYSDDEEHSDGEELRGPPTLLTKDNIESVKYPESISLTPIIRGDVIYYPIEFLKAFSSECQLPPAGFKFDAPTDDRQHGHPHRNDQRTGMRRSASGRGERGPGRSGSYNRPPAPQFGGDGHGRPIGRNSQERFSMSSQQGGPGGDRSGPGLGPRAPSGRMSQSGRESRGGRRARGRGRGDGHGHHDNSHQAKPVVLLPKSENRWKPSRQADKAGENSTIEVVERQTKILLNKLTPDNFEQVSNDIIDVANKSKEESDGHILRRAVIIIFEKATDEPTFSATYAQLCKKMITSIDPEIVDKNVLTKDGRYLSGGLLVRKYLLNRCQEGFDLGWKVDMPDDIESDEYYKAAKIKRQGLGLIQFIGELFLLDMLTLKIMHECVKRLLSNINDPEEEEIESLAKLMTTIGKKFDTEDAAEVIDVYFERIRLLSVNKKLSSRIRFMLKDVIDLRSAKWVSRRKNDGPKTIAEIHEEEERKREAALRKSASNTRSMSGIGGQQFGRGRRDPRERESRQGRSSWNTVGGSSNSGRSDSMTTRPENLTNFGNLSRSKNSPSPSTNPFQTLGKGSRGWNSNSSTDAHRSGPTPRSVSLYGSTSSRMASTLPKSGNGSDKQESPGSSSGKHRSNEKMSIGNMYSALYQHDDTHASPRAGPIKEKDNIPEISSTLSESASNVKLMDSKVLKRKVKGMVDEFLGLKDFEELIECVKELEEPNYPNAAVEFIEYSITLKPLQVDLVAQGFGKLHKSVISEDTFVGAFTKASKHLEDLEDDIPLIYTFFGKLLSGSEVSVTRVAEASGVSENPSAYKAVLEYLKEEMKKKGQDELKSELESAGFDVKKALGEMSEERVNKEFEKRDLSTLLSQ